MPVKYIDANGKEEDPILIMRLSRNQMLDFRLIAKKGIGRVHAKWSPVATCIMRPEVITEVNQKKLSVLTKEQKMQVVASCPRKTLSYNSITGNIDVNESAKDFLSYEPVHLLQSAEFGKLENAIRVDERDDKFIFTIESTGALRPEEIVIKSLRVLSQKVEQVKLYI